MTMIIMIYDDANDDDGDIDVLMYVANDHGYDHE